MLRKFYLKFIKPVSDDPDTYSRELVLNWLLCGIIFLAFCTSINMALTVTLLNRPHLTGRVAMILAIGAGWVGLYLLARYKRRLTFVSFVLLLTLFAIAAWLAIGWGIYVPVSNILFGLVVIASGILLGARYAFYATLVIGSFLIWLEHASHTFLPPDLEWQQRQARLSDVAVQVTLYALIALVSWLFNRQMERSLDRARRSEQALQNQNTRLEAIVDERTRELQAAQLDRTQQLYRFAELGQLSTALLHDLANHMTVLSLDLEDIKATHHKPEVLQDAMRSIGYIDGMVRQVQAQLEGKNQVTRFNLTSEVDEVLTILRRKAQDAGVELRLERPKTTVMYTGDALKLRQIMANLVSNAIDAYTASAVGPKSVEISVSKQANECTVRVRDFGRGISAAQLTKIFEPFYGTKASGMGMGLYIAKRLIEREFHGGIDVTSKKGETCFSIHVKM